MELNPYVLELSYSAQFYQYLRSKLDLPENVTSIARSGGKPFGFREIYDIVAQEATAHV